MTLTLGTGRKYSKMFEEVHLLLIQRDNISGRDSLFERSQTLVNKEVELLNQRIMLLAIMQLEYDSAYQSFIFTIKASLESFIP